MAATVLRRSCGMRGSGAEVPKKEGKMTTSIKLAVPTMGAAGLNAERSGHFGHCDCFTVVDIVDGVVSEEATMVANPPHEEGGCLRPVGSSYRCQTRRQSQHSRGTRFMQQRSACRANCVWLRPDR